MAAVAVVLAIAAPAGAQTYTVTTYAGGWGGSYDGTGSAARFISTAGVAVDGSGNVYVADSYTIRKITSAGVVSTVAGLERTYGSRDGFGFGARFYQLAGVGVDGGGNLYVADQSNHTIRKITPGGAVTTLAGKAGTGGSTDGVGGAARFYFPTAVVPDGSGNVFVADTYNSSIRKITPAGVVTTFATGLSGAAGLTIDSSSNLYVACGDHTIRKITSSAVVSMLAGLAGSSGTTDGTGSAARFYSPTGITLSPDGNLYVTDHYNHTIRQVTMAGVVSTVAGVPGVTGGEDGSGAAARFFYPASIAADALGNLYVADGADAIRKITPAFAVTTFAGVSAEARTLDGTPADARFNGLYGIAFDPSGNIYLAEYRGQTIRKITPAGTITTFAGAAGVSGSTDGTGAGALFNRPFGVATDSSGNVYVADSNNYTIRKITSDGVVTTLAGSAGLYGSADGTGSAARFWGSTGIALDSAGNIYVGDQSNDTVRKITPLGAVTTLAGSPGVAGSADGTGSGARFDHPAGIAVDSSNNVFVVDRYNDTIRKITPTGVVTTLAGSPGVSGSADGTGSAARFLGPYGLTIDSSGNLFVMDGALIRKVTPAGVVTTLAGSPGYSGPEDGSGSFAGVSPVFGAIDSSQNLWFTHGNLVRVAKPALSDVATIDFSTGAVGATRQLSTSPQTATTWTWTEIRKPASSTAQLSSPSTRNPVFTPDVADLFMFRLVASNGVSTSITRVDLTAGSATTMALTSSADPALAGQTITFTATVTSPGGTPTGTVTFTDGTKTLGLATIDGSGHAAVSTTLSTGTHLITAQYGGDGTFVASETSGVETVDPDIAPLNVVATATSGTSVSITWTGRSGSSSYEVARSTGGGSFTIVGSPSVTSFTDTTAVANTAYLYKVRALDIGGNRSLYSSPDLATTVMFTNDPLIAMSTIVKAVHVTELRLAVNAVQSLAGRPVTVFTDATITTATAIRKVHIDELRAALSDARAALGLPAISYTDPVITAQSSTVRAVHLQELRIGVK